jgi:hypothetical protein
MIRALVVELQQIKRAVQDEFRNLGDEKLHLEQKVLKVKEQLADTQSKLDRANLFPKSHGDSDPPVCLRCFVYHNQPFVMSPAPSPSPQIDIFKCKQCESELQVEM